MNRKSEAAHDFAKDNVAQKIIMGYDVAARIEGNPHVFVNMPVPGSDLRSLTDKLQASAEAARSGDHVASAQLIVDIKKWNNGYLRTADAVSLIANNDPTIIALAGFKATSSETHPSTEPGAGENFQVSIPQGSHGMIDASCDTMARKASAYCYIAAPEGVRVEQDHNQTRITIGDVSVVVIVDTHSHVRFANMPNQKVHVSMFAVNTAGTGPATTAKDVTPQ